MKQKVHLELTLKSFEMTLCGDDAYQVLDHIFYFGLQGINKAGLELEWTYEDPIRFPNGEPLGVFTSVVQFASRAS